MFNLANIILETLKNKGYSVNIQGQKPKSGYMVALRDREVVVETSKPLSFIVETLQKFISDNQFDLDQSGHYLGTWIDKGKMYIDISFNYQDLNVSIDMAYLSNQLSIYDIKEKRVISTTFERVSDQTLFETTKFYQWLKGQPYMTFTKAMQLFTNEEKPLIGRPDGYEYIEIYKSVQKREGILMALGRFL